MVTALEKRHSCFLNAFGVVQTTSSRVQYMEGRTARRSLYGNYIDRQRTLIKSADEDHTMSYPRKKAYALLYSYGDCLGLYVHVDACVAILRLSLRYMDDEKRRRNIQLEAASVRTAQILQQISPRTSFCVHSYTVEAILWFCLHVGTPRYVLLRVPSYYCRRIILNACGTMSAARRFF